MPYLLDADTCIYAINHKLTPQAALNECGISQILLGELEYGIARSAPACQEQNRRALLDFLSSIEVYPLTNDVPPIYGELRATLARKGQIIGGNDLWIAAHALALDLPLVTNNTREFARVPNLSIETWMKQ